MIDVLRKTARVAVGAEGIAIVLKDGDHCSYVAEDAIAPLWQGQSFPADTCISGWSMLHGETVAIGDIRRDPRVPQEAYAATFVRSLVMAPIGKPEPVAALGAYWSNVMSHDAETIERVEGLARLATIAIENARLAEARDHAAALSAAQARILELAVQDGPLQATLEAIVRAVESLSDSGVMASILLLDEDGVHLRHGAGPSLPAAYNALIDGIVIGPTVGSCGSAIFRQEPVFVADIASDPLWTDYRDLAMGHGLRACWSLPIRSAHGKILGTFAMYYSEPREPVSADLEIVDFVVRTAGVVLARARSEAIIRHSEARYRQIVEGAEDFAIVSLDQSGVITGWNSGAEHLMDWNPQEALGQHACLFFTAEDQAADAPAREMQQADTYGRGIDERWHVRKDGTRFWGSGLTMPLAGREGGYVKMFRDRTREHEAEEALRELNATLEARVCEAVTEREMAQEALRQSQKMEAMGQLTGGVAHDFNNLLTPIVGSLDLLQRRNVGGEREQRLIAAAVQSAERAKTLVQRLLAFARRQPLQSVSVDVAKLVHGMGELVESTTGPQIKVVVEAADDLPPAKADLNQLEMALLNLSVNARDAMPGGGMLRISAGAEVISTGHRSGLRPGRYVCLSVADTGSGMDEATRARAVEPFFSTKGIGKGTGLGLSMVHGLASQLGGGLTIQSRPGLGTNIELWLPVSDEDVQPVALPKSVGDIALRGVALLVDDESLVRMSTADMLCDLGYAVEEADCAEEAVRILATGAPFDVVITDHLMPGMTGVDLARHIQSTRPHVPVLLVSGYADAEGVDSDLPRLTKPFRKDDLAAALASTGSSSSR
ncbi:GAF domain-containing hybrid sensor histidine kinase/response regulator [Novosphingobium terrae]|uniref:GAF domain-containing hybrid sensor histidine kinase/response regulator n=1 Tax=Novosphingobium terrae TaxID=2726189 RepID=UPI001F132BEA|nr:GAF domain-containing protein [Novosphingobium terrae]